MASMKRRWLTGVGIASLATLGLTACSGGGGGGGSDLTAGPDQDLVLEQRAGDRVGQGDGRGVERRPPRRADRRRRRSRPARAAKRSSAPRSPPATRPASSSTRRLRPSPEFQKQGGLVDLSEFKDGDDYIEARSGDLAEQYTVADGEYYQMPWKSNPVMIFYNKDMFTKAGLDPENPRSRPTTSSSPPRKTLVEQRRRARTRSTRRRPASSSRRGSTSTRCTPRETGGTQLVEDGKATFDSTPRARRSPSSGDASTRRGCAGKEEYNGDSFADGQAAMAIVGPWAISVYEDNVNWGPCPCRRRTARPPTETYTFSDAKNVGLYSACKNQGTAWDVLKFATSEEQDGQLLETDRPDAAAHRPADHLRRLLRGQPRLQAVRRPGEPHRRGARTCPNSRGDLAGLPRRLDSRP